MASVGTHKVPRENKNESRWFKFFTIGQLVVLLLQGIIDVGIVKMAASFGLTVVGVFIALFLSIIVGVIVMGRMPYSRYLLACGQPFYILLFRMVAHRILHKYLYMRNYDSKTNTNEKGGNGRGFASFFN